LQKERIARINTVGREFAYGLVSISAADKANGSPKAGDMIAFNPKDSTDI